MSDEKNTNETLKEFDNLHKKQNEDIDKYNGVEKNTTEKKENSEKSEEISENTDKKPIEEIEQVEESNNNQYDFDGTSNAYDKDIKKMGKGQQAGSSEKPSRFGGLTPPKRDKSRSKSGTEDDIMKFIWNEFIVGFYTWVLDKSVDTVLRFSDFVLFTGYEGAHSLVNITKKEKKAEKTPFDYGDDLIHEDAVAAVDRVILFNKAHKELMDNIEKDKAGVPLQWKEWEEKPEFFDKLKDTALKAEKNPNSPEAATWKRIKDGPKTIETLLKKEVLLRKISVGIAAIDNTLNTDSGTKVPSSVTKAAENMEKLLNDDKMDDGKFKENMGKEIEKLRSSLSKEKDNFVKETVSEQLSGIEKILNEPGKNKEQQKEALQKEISSLKESAPVKQKIREESKTYYNELNANIDKIIENNKDDPEKMNKTIGDYMKHITSAIETAKADTDKWLSSSKVTGKKNKKTAQNSFTEAKNSINNFMIDGKPIGEKEKASFESKNPVTGNKYDIFRAISERCGGR